MYATRFHRPATLAEAVRLFAEADDARYLSGGQTLIPTMKQRLAAPSDVISIARLEELKGISENGDVLSIGAASTHAEVHGSATVRQAIPALAAPAGSIGDPAVRERGTIGGSLANNDPAADYPASVLALGATIHTDRRRIAADHFFTGLFETGLAEGEIIIRIDFPVPDRAAYDKLRHPASRYAMTGAFVAVMKDGAVRVSITGAGADGVFRATAIEELLARSWDPAAIDSVEIDPGGILSDVHGSAAYRAHLVKVMAKRAAIAAA